MTAPITYTWNGEAMEPLRRFHNVVNRDFVVGETYTLVEESERSEVSHRHFFASIRETWLNLPDHLATEFATPEHLRKRALIETGHYDERRLVASSPEEARKIAAFMGGGDDFAVVSVAGNVVIERKAKSQSRRNMRKAEFQKSKDDVLGYCDQLLGVERGTVAKESGRAA